jgi:hypothetical protein
MSSRTATTGPENPLKTYTSYVSLPSTFIVYADASHSDELSQIAKAETAYNNAIDAFKAAQARGEPKERVEELRDLARSKEEDLKGLQDLCD